MTLPALVLAITTAATPIFQLHTDEFWLNLHHFLYVLGRAENRARDAQREAVVGAPKAADRGVAGMTDAERQAWADAVHAYAAGLSKKDAVFDAPLPAIAAALAAARNGASLAAPGVPPDVAQVLQKVAPIYRKAWWPEHHEANQRWRTAIDRLVQQHGSTVLAFIEKAYGLRWPTAGFPVHVAAYANWAGAYSTDGNLLVLSSLAPGNQGMTGLESIFHEGMHQWDEHVEPLLQRMANDAGKRLDRNLSHAIIFYTAGDAVRRVAPGYTPYADANGVWSRGMDALRPALVELWQPYLDGQGTRDEALSALVARTGR